MGEDYKIIVQGDEEVDLKVTDIPLGLKVGDRYKCTRKDFPSFYGEVSTVLGWVPNYYGYPHIAVRFPEKPATLWSVSGFYRYLEKDGLLTLEDFQKQMNDLRSEMNARFDQLMTHLEYMPFGTKYSEIEKDFDCLKQEHDEDCSIKYTRI